MKNDQGLLNGVFDTYRSCRSFLKEMHINLDYCCPHQDPEVRKQDPYGMDSNISEENLGGDAEDVLGQNNGTPSKGDVSENGEPNMVKEAKRCLYD